MSNNPGMINILYMLDLLDEILQLLEMVLINTSY